MHSSEMNKVSPGTFTTRPILKRRSLLTQKNADLCNDKPSYMNLAFEGSRTEEEGTNDSISESYCGIGGDSGSNGPSQGKSKKSVHFASGTEFYERNMNSNFWRNIEKRRRYYNNTNAGSLAHLRRRRAHIFYPHLQTWVRGHGESFFNDRNSAHFYYYRTNSSPSVDLPRVSQDNNNVCCLESLSRRLRNLVCCVSEEIEEEESSDYNMVLSHLESSPQKTNKSRSI